MRIIKLLQSVGVLALTGAMAAAVAQPVTVGVVASATGSGAVLGIPYKNVFEILPRTMGGQDVKYVFLDDTSDVTTGVKNARKLLDEDKVDVLVGSNSVPVTMAIMQLATETGVPHLSLSPIEVDAAKAPWTFGVPQPIGLMMGEVVEDMKKRGITQVAYIGFADSWGDAVYRTLIDQGAKAGMTITTNERYQRNDTSVTTQVLKMMQGNPQAVVVGASGAAGALPHMALNERGYKGLVYNTHGSVSPDFIRIGGAAAEGAQAPAGPYLFAGQLPDTNPIKPVAAKALARYDEAYGAKARSPFAGYAFDAYELLNAAVPVAAKNATPGTPQFRKALRDALENDVKEVVGTMGIYTMSPTDHNGLDERARVRVKVENGSWKVQQ